MKFLGVKQGPQAAARFVLSNKIFFTRVRYAVILPSGPMAGVNLVEGCKPAAEVRLGVRVKGDQAEIFWPSAAGEWVLQETPGLNPPTWSAVNLVPLSEEDQPVVRVPVAGTKFYRLTK
ncbi:MAG: hypothetical protein N3G20_05320 [Verrucomicrobiae bacterium]|nr:hypothetical protein [Verrucomicrobiae bacterium]